jgi:predicted dehydrogenase
LQISHLASLMFHLTGSLRPKTVSAMMDNLDCAVDVVDACVVRMENGALVTVGSTGNLGQGDGGIVEVHLHGSKGRLLVEAISGHIYLRLHDGTERRIEPSFPGYPSDAPTQHFVEMIRTGETNLLPGATVGLYTVELLDAAYRSAALEGQPVQVSSLYA